MSILLPRGASPIVYLGRQVVTDALNLDFTWTLDCEAVFLEYRNIKPIAAAERFAALHSSADGGATWNEGATDYDMRVVIWSTGQVQSLATAGNNMGRPTSGASPNGMDNGANEFGQWTMVLTRPFDTGRATRGFGWGGFNTQANVPTLTKWSGVRRANERTDGIRFFFTDGGGSKVDNLEGEVRGYGILRYPGGLQAIPSYHMPDRLGVPLAWEFIGQEEISNQLTAEFNWSKPYDKVMAILHNVAPVTAGSLDLELSTDGGSTWLTTGYESRGNLWATGTGTSTAASHGKLTSTGPGNQPANDAQAYTGVCEIVEIHNPSDSTRYTQYTAIGGMKVEPSNTDIPIGAWGQHTTAAVHNAVRFQVRNRTFGNLGDGAITLLGLNRLAA